MKLLLGASVLAVAFAPIAALADDVGLTYAERSVDLENGTEVVHTGFVRVVDSANARSVVVFGSDGRRQPTLANDPAVSCLDLASRIVPVAARSTVGVPTDAGTLNVDFASGRTALPMILDVEPLGNGIARATVDATLAAAAHVATFGGSVDYANGVVLGAQFATASSMRGAAVTRGTCRLDLVIPGAGSAPAAAPVPVKSA